MARLTFYFILATSTSYIWGVTAKTISLRQANTQLQLSPRGWDQAYDSPRLGPGGGWREPRRQRLWNGVEQQRVGPPSIYNEAPRATDEGWWNEEKRDFSTSENRRELRKYSNSMYSSGFIPISNAKYDVTPDEWRERGLDSVGPYGRGNYYDRHGGYGGNNAYNGNYNNRYYQDGPSSNGYSYGFGNRRGQILGSYDPYQGRGNPNSVQPLEWQEHNNRNNYVEQDYYRNGGGYDQRRDYNGGGPYEPQRNNGWRDNRSFSSGYGTSMDQEYSVVPDEWRNGGGGGQHFVNYNNEGGGRRNGGRSPYEPRNNWWDKMKDGLNKWSSTRRQDEYSGEGMGYNGEW